MKRRSDKVSGGKDDKGEKVVSEGSVLGVTVILNFVSIRPRRAFDSREAYNRSSKEPTW